MKREAPTEREIADLIAPAYEGVASPDARRLAAIEQQLLEQPRLRGRTKYVWWWLVGALVAGAASALWWVVGYDPAVSRKAPERAVISPAVAPSEAEPPMRPSRHEGTESKPAVEPDRKNGPMIYQRER